MQQSIVGFSLEGASNALRSRQRWPGGDAVNNFTIDGAASVRRGGADDPECYQGAKTSVYELVTNLLATTGALAFHDNGDNVGGSMGIISFATPYGFVGFNPDRISPDVLSSSSSALGAYDGCIVKRSYLTLICVHMGTMVLMPMAGWIKDLSTNMWAVKSSPNIYSYLLVKTIYYVEKFLEMTKTERTDSLVVNS